MSLHSVKLERLTEAVSLDVESYRLSEVKWQDHPYEGRQGPSYKTEPIHEQRIYPRGTLVVQMNQRAARVAMHLLEPKGPDSFAAWGFFNTIFEQKEYAEEYVMEKVGRETMTEHSGLKKEFEQKVA